jgi:hypothetical protein
LDKHLKYKDDYRKESGFEPKVMEMPAILVGCLFHHTTPLSFQQKVSRPLAELAMAIQQFGPPRLLISRLIRVHGKYVCSFFWVYKPTYNWGQHPVYTKENYDSIETCCNKEKTQKRNP